MADRLEPRTASRPADAGAGEPAKKRPILPPMPEEKSAKPAKQPPAAEATPTPVAETRPAAAATPAPARRAQTPPAAANEDTAIREPLTRRIQAKLTSAPAAGDTAPMAAVTAPAAPATRPAAVPAGGASATRPAPAARVSRPAAVTPPAPTAAPTATPKAAASGVRRPVRRARLRLTRIDPWSVMKTSFLLSVAAGIVTVVAVLCVWLLLSAAGLWDSINSTVQSFLEEGDSFDVTDYLGISRVLGFATLVAIFDVILLTAMATLAAFLYNMAAALLGGVEVTLTEDAA